MAHYQQFFYIIIWLLYQTGKHNKIPRATICACQRNYAPQLLTNLLSFNKRPELVTKWRHENNFYAANQKARPLQQPSLNLVSTNSNGTV